MRIVYSSKALLDLRRIGQFIRAQSPKGALNVRADIRDAARSAAEFPLSGRRIAKHGVRKLVSRRYRYVIYYLVEADIDAIQVVAIFHPAQDRSDEAEWRRRHLVSESHALASTARD